MEIRHLESLVIGHYSMLCSMGIGFLLFVVIRMYRRIQETKMGHLREYGKTCKFLFHHITMFVIELCGVALFWLLSIVLNKLAFAWSSALMTGIYAIALGTVCDRLCRGLRGMVMLVLEFLLVILIYLCVSRIGDNHFQLCVLIKIFAVVEAVLAEIMIIFALLKGMNKETVW